MTSSTISKIVNLTIQRTHLHLIVEAETSEALSRGMQAFQISAAKQLNAAVSRAGGWWERRQGRAKLFRDALRVNGALRVESASVKRRRAAYALACVQLPKRRKGRVFADRYHARMITSPRQAHRELAYVLNNWRKRGEDREGVARTWIIDPYATGWCFDGWRERADSPFVWQLRASYEPIPVYVPRMWLLREGWRRHGLISTHEVPGSSAAGRPRAQRASRTTP